MSKLYEGRFESVLDEANQKFFSRLPKYGDSWEGMTVKELEARLEHEIGEWRSASSHDEEYDELVDVINCALMLAKVLEKCFD